MEKFIAIKKVKNTVPWAYVISDRNGEEIIVIFKKKNRKNKSNRVEKVIKRKGDELYFKWKSYDYSFNSCVNKKYCYIK